MGKLYYGYGSEPLNISDRLLAHIRVVAMTKLRRQESFPLTWLHGEGEEGGRTTMWIHAAIPLKFVFDCEKSEAVDRAILQQLVDEANTTAGMVIGGGDTREVERPVDLPARNRAAA